MPLHLHFFSRNGNVPFEQSAVLVIKVFFHLVEPVVSVGLGFAGGRLFVELAAFLYALVMAVVKVFGVQVASESVFHKNGFFILGGIEFVNISEDPFSVLVQHLYLPQVAVLLRDYIV